MLDSPVLQIQVHAGDASEVTLVLSGELDLSTCSTLRARVEELEPMVRHLVLDLAGLEFIDSTAIALLLGFERSFSSHLRQLTVRCPPGHVRRVLQMSGADTRMTVIP